MSLSWSGKVEEWQRESAAELLSCRFEVSDLQRQCGELRGDGIVKHSGWPPGSSTGIHWTHSSSINKLVDVACLPVGTLKIPETILIYPAYVDTI